jgi:uncharacterized protein involved in response to NO
MAPIPRLKYYAGPAILSYGFRPFFLAGALYAGLAVLLWLPTFYGELAVGTTFVPRDWHVHEMLYGYVPAIVTGFLLTAIPNWTGRLPLQGASLLVFVTVWLLGRIAVTTSAAIGWAPALAIDAAFLILVAVAATREIVGGRNWRNLKVVSLVAVLALGNIAFHLEAHAFGTAEYSTRLGLAAIVLLISLVGGRIVPSFTRNWLARESPGRMPAPFGRFDIAVIAISTAALSLWVVAPDTYPTGVLLLLSGALQLVRLARWAGERTVHDRLVLILHLGYAFLPAGFLLMAGAAFELLPAAAGMHAWAGGAVGTMTLAVMTRASLGHTGRPLVAPPTTQAIYAAIIVAAVARICAAMHPAYSVSLLHVAAFAWAAAFLGFAACFASSLMSQRPSGAARR